MFCCKILCLIHKNNVTIAAHCLSFEFPVSFLLSFLQTLPTSSSAAQTMAYSTRRAVKPKGYYVALNATSTVDLIEAEEDGSKGPSSLRGSDVFAVDRIVAERTVNTPFVHCTLYRNQLSLHFRVRTAAERNTSSSGRTTQRKTPPEFGRGT